VSHEAFPHLLSPTLAATSLESGETAGGQTPGDPIARRSFFSGTFRQPEGILVNPEKEIGASMLNRNSNSDVISLLLVNCVENHRKFGKMGN
jgi:hypothetical protein